MGLEGLLQSRASVLHGITNGIDTEAWNPQLDAAHLLHDPLDPLGVDDGRRCRRTAWHHRRHGIAT